MRAVNLERSLKRLAAETGAGQWGSALKPRYDASFARNSPHLLGRCSALLRADSHSYSTLIDFLSVRVARI